MCFHFFLLLLTNLYLPFVDVEGIVALGHSQWHSILGRNNLDEGLARHRDLCLATPNSHNKHASKLPAGFEPAIPTSEPPLTHTSERAATEICCTFTIKIISLKFAFLWRVRCEFQVVWNILLIFALNGSKPTLYLVAVLFCIAHNRT